jgi:dTDP-4-amino-4,6-dideoxygalactose transaminase
VFVLYPDPYSLPSYRIGPFKTTDLSINHYLPESDRIDTYFTQRFGSGNFYYTYNGREAIHIALGHYLLEREDVVTILTSSGNFYISSCVTNEIEKFCKWSREIVPDTKVLFVNHEFGYPYEKMKELNETGLPIIEDCAGSFFSEDNAHSIGRTGDFVIYSFPKMFPIQVGGLLVAKDHETDCRSSALNNKMRQYIKNVLSENIQYKDKIISQRISNYTGLRERFSSLGLHERFELGEGIVPGVFMFRTDSHNLNLPELKKHFWAHGIQSSVFYGENAFFIPVHQALQESDLDYFYEVIKEFIQKNK